MIVPANTCVEPAPTGDLSGQLSINPNPAVTEFQKAKIVEQGTPYAYVEIQPSPHTWIPPIHLTVVLKPKAPSDNFKVYVYVWDNVERNWVKAGEGTATREGDVTVTVDIDHASLLSIVDPLRLPTVTPVPSTPTRVVPSPSPLPRQSPAGVPSPSQSVVGNSRVLAR